jgi:hypothetical protein
VDAITPTGSRTRDPVELEKPAAAAASVFETGALSAIVSGELTFRCLAGPVSLVSFFGVEDLDVRGFGVLSAAALTSGAEATVSSAIFVFFEALLLDCMELIRPHENKFVSICLNSPDAFNAC